MYTVVPRGHRMKGTTWALRSYFAAKQVREIVTSALISTYGIAYKMSSMVHHELLGYVQKMLHVSREFKLFHCGLTGMLYTTEAQAAL